MQGQTNLNFKSLRSQFVAIMVGIAVAISAGVVSAEERPINSVKDAISPELKKNFYQAMMKIMPTGMDDMFNLMTHKVLVEEGVEWEDVIDAMDSKAVELNFKKVGRNTMWKEIEAKTGKTPPRSEIFHYCDAMVAREILDYAPEFIIYLPCRVGLIEDNKGRFWLMTMDWDVNWILDATHPDSELEEQLIKNAIRVHDSVWAIMEAGASGEW